METVSARRFYYWGWLHEMGQIFQFLEQIALSPVAHVPTCCDDFCVCRERKMTSEYPEIPEMLDAFGPQQPTTQYVHVCWNFTSVFSSIAAPV